jgi:hypothetical protein
MSDDALQFRTGISFPFFHLGNPWVHPLWMSLLAMVFIAPMVPFASDSKTLRLNGASISAGDWITFTENDRQSRSDYGSIGMGLYFSGWGWSGSLGLPVKTSFKRLQHETRITLGDGEITVGKRHGIVSGRAILRVPFYEWSTEDASVNALFIGTGTIRGGMGLGSKLPKHWLPTAFSAGLDVEATTPLTQALADFGSTHVLGNVYVTRTLGSKGKLGLNALLLFDHLRWVPDFWDQKQETKFFVLPGAMIGWRLFKATSIDVKAGITVYEFKNAVEPRYTIRPSNSYYFSASIFQGF